ncbi:MAG: penicillin-binding protein 1A [Gammaproteobacteria bacterium]
MLLKLFKWLSVIAVFFIIAGATAGYIIIGKLSEELPDIEALKDVQYQIPLKVYSKDGFLIAEFGEKKRTPVDIGEVPDRLIKAFLAAEDNRFFEHPGVDIKGLLRAGMQLALTGEKKQGGSTITMQVTRNFLLSREKTYTRKIKEIILAIKIEQAFTKDKIIELYLNKIYLGNRSYGVAAAAQTYYGKPLDQLTLAQCAMIAGLPKAPSAFNPIVNEKRALERRDYILKRMHELGYIDEQALNKALSEPSNVKVQRQSIDFSSPFLAEMVRRQIIGQYGEEAYNSGMSVYTTITRPLQTAAVKALRHALHEYDERHGYRYDDHEKINKTAKFEELPVIGDSLPAQVTALSDDNASARLQNDTTIEIPWHNIKWARKFISRNAVGPWPKNIGSVLKDNDIIYVRELDDHSWSLAQIPEVEGAFVALDPNDGAILALTGGFDFFHNKFNRATQSIRQPGSGFKPIIYTTALENGYTAASMINDAPIVVDTPSSGDEWRPENYSRKFYGPTSLRSALRYSRNLISIRLLQQLGIEKVTDTAVRFGFDRDQLPESLTLALGSGQASPLQMARMFSVFANGGFLIEPYYIARIESAEGKRLFEAQPVKACYACNENSQLSHGQAPRIIAPQVDFIMNSLLRDVVQRGTATKAKVLGRQDLAGKTGTTNDQKDAWFNGFVSEIAATAWVGFDNPTSLGSRETGGAAALPMWIDFMREALKDIPEQPLVPPEGIVKLWVSQGSETSASNAEANGFWEYFDADHVPGAAETGDGNDASGISGPTATRADKKPMEMLF